MRKLLKFLVADIRIKKKTEIILRYLLISFALSQAIVFLIIWIPLSIYGEVLVIEPSYFIRLLEVIFFFLVIGFSLWMAVFYARLINRK